jgi:NTP pyrophosphatase (non-canonical NTP hydrolase)
VTERHENILRKDLTPIKLRHTIYDMISDERAYQDRLHPQWRGDDHGLAVLAEEFGEVARALYELNQHKGQKTFTGQELVEHEQKFEQLETELQSELIQVAAVCVRWIEERYKLHHGFDSEPVNVPQEPEPVRFVNKWPPYGFKQHNPRVGLPDKVSADDVLRGIGEMANNPVLRSVMAKIASQTTKGLEKYGASVDPDTLDMKEWITHAQQEIIDHLIYLECMKSKVGGE